MAEKLGTIKVSDSTDINEARLSVRCAFGEIVASVTGDPGIYDEIEIDLVTPDGRTLQLAVVGCDENDEGLEGCGGRPSLHAYVWDGKDSDCSWEHDIEASDESPWC